MEANMDRPSMAPPIPADAAVFTFGSGAAWVMLFGMLIAATEATLLLVHAWTTVDPTTRLTQIPEGVFFALVAELNWRLYRRSRDRVAVNQEGIWSVRRKGTDYLDWRSVAQVRADDTQQRLELVDASGATAVRVEYQLRAFESLRDFILNHAAKSGNFLSPSVSVFHRSWNTKLIWAATAAVLFLMAWRVHVHNLSQGFVVFVVFGAVALYFFLSDPVSMVVGRDALTIHYPIHQGMIPFSTITGIALSDVRKRENVQAGVVIQRRAGRAVKLFRIREGSVALYEALQAAWRSAVEADGQTAASPNDAAASTPGLTEVAARAQARAPAAKLTGIAFAVALFTIPALVATLHRSGLGRMIGDALASRYASSPTYEKHIGPVAQLSELTGTGRIYLVQMGDHAAPYSLNDFAQWLRTKYALDVEVLPAMQIDASAWDAKRKQYVAELLEGQLKQQHADLAANHEAYLIGFTDENMFSTMEMWSGTFTQRDSMRAAIISSDGMGDTAWERTHLSADGATSRLQARMRRILLKDIAILYWHLPVNDDRTSLLHDTLDPDLPVEDIFESDLDPALSAEGVRLDEPCIFFAYSIKDGMKPLPGALIRGCGGVQDPMEDESVELFELVLRTGLLIDKHTDLYLPDVIPIEFQRVTRDGWRGKGPLGTSGTDNYDEFLGSADNIRVFVEHADGGRDDLVRVPLWLPVLPLVKYVGGESERMFVPSGRGGTTVTRVWQYEMAWHRLPFEHYDVRRFNGGVKTYLPCDSPTVNCLLVGYQDHEGRELRIERGNERQLTRLTSPGGSWVGVGSAPDGRITAILDNRSRAVTYGYDQRNRLVRVTYASGAIFSYEYDDAQHMLSLRVSPDGHAEPQVVLGNKYEHGMLTTLTLPDGGVYTCAYDSTDAMANHRTTVHTPDDREFDVELRGRFWTVKEKMDHAQAGSGAPR
jgi:YD repeat-containing protein